MTHLLPGVGTIPDLLAAIGAARRYHAGSVVRIFNMLPSTSLWLSANFFEF